jgi:hypothetical protein
VNPNKPHIANSEWWESFLSGPRFIALSIGISTHSPKKEDKKVETVILILVYLIIEKE